MQPVTSSSQVNNSLKIAYANNCSVSTAPQATSLQQLAISLQYYNSDNASFQSYCTGTPVQYNSQTGIGFVVTAAHCVIGNQAKVAGVQITESDISTYDVSNGHNSAWIYQSTPARGLNQSQLSGQITAIYVPSQYCQAGAIKQGSDGGYSCVPLSVQNGDVAVIKIQNQPNNILQVNPSVKLAAANYSITSTSYLLGLGYGRNTSADPTSNILYYINYQYLGTNTYMGLSGESVIMNGYIYNNAYYSIICGGDSGGGDFAWDGVNWNLIGVHSYGSLPCGAASTNYSQAYDASADERPFNSWISNVLQQDTQATGCANLGSQYVCKSGVGQ